jgi:amphi-Trp domain-containing protein
MDLIEFEEQRTMRREDAAKRLHEIADALASNNAFEFERNGRRFTVHVPDEVELSVEFEAGDEGRELEIELSW